MTYRVLVTDPLGDLGVQILREAPDVELLLEPGMPPEQLLETIPDCHALIVRSGTKVTPEVIAAADQLLVIGRAGVGVDNVAVEAATRKGIAVTNTPHSNTNAAVEQTMALMLAAARNTIGAHSSLAAGEWRRTDFVGTELCDKTLGVIGFGRIGRRVAALAQAFGMQVVAYDPYVSELIGREAGVTLVELNDLLERSDVITLHMASPDHLPVIDREALGRVKPGAMIVNTARGWLLDAKAVAEALDADRLGAVAVDVYDREPPGSEHPLVGHPKVVHTPHLGASTREAQADVSSNIARQVLTILRSEGYPNSINIALADDPLSTPILYLSERMGRLHAAMADDPIDRIEVEVTGDLPDDMVATAATGALKGILDARSADPVNHVSAPYLASEHGITVSTGRGIGTTDYHNVLTVRAHFGGDHRTISGVVFGGTEPRIIRISRFHLDAEPAGTVLLLLNDDVPGVVGKVGGILGAQEVNIAEWRLGREEAGGTAISFINLDSVPSEAALGELSSLPEVSKVAVVDL